MVIKQVKNGMVFKYLSSYGDEVEIRGIKIRVVKLRLDGFKEQKVTKISYRPKKKS